MFFFFLLLSSRGGRGGRDFLLLQICSLTFGIAFYNLLNAKNTLLEIQCFGDTDVSQCGFISQSC